MSTNTVKKIEKTISETSGLNKQKKTELLELLGNLKNELKNLEKTHLATAKNIAGLAEHSTAKAAGKRDDKTEAIQDLKSSVAEFEVSHPDLVQIINRICMMLSDIGI
ncbi:MAG: DUF4404 family protein [Victivallaceae bacterium]